jgi:hypothetical protein
VAVLQCRPVERWEGHDVQVSQYVAAGAIGAIIAIGFAVAAFIMWISVRREGR